MTHKEFILTVKETIFENSGTIKTPAYKIGEHINVSEDIFESLQKGNTIERITQSGVVSYDKYSFENEVNYTQVTVEYGVKKLGQRKK